MVDTNNPRPTEPQYEEETHDKHGDHITDHFGLKPVYSHQQNQQIFAHTNKQIRDQLAQHHFRGLTGVISCSKLPLSVSRSMAKEVSMVRIFCSIADQTGDK